MGIHRYVELLDKYFGSVCELDIIFNFEKAYFMLDELLIGGEVQETSKKNVLKAIAAQDLLQERKRPKVSLKMQGWANYGALLKRIRFVLRICAENIPCIPTQPNIQI